MYVHARGCIYLHECVCMCMCMGTHSTGTREADKTIALVSVGQGIGWALSSVCCTIFLLVETRTDPNTQ